METQYKWPQGQTNEQTTYSARIVMILIVVALLAGVAAYIYYGMNHTPADRALMTTPSESETVNVQALEVEPSSLTLEDREARVRELELLANPDGLTVEEREARLQELAEAHNQMVEITPVDYESYQPSEEVPPEVIESNLIEPNGSPEAVRVFEGSPGE